EESPPRCSCIIVIHANQYWATRYQTVWAWRGAVASMSRTGNCYDNNAPVERCFGSLKNELGRHREFQNQGEARQAIIASIEECSTPASAGIRRWAIGAQRRSSRWPVSLHPGVRYFRATSGLAITQLPFDTSFVPRLSASDAAHRVCRPIILLSGAGIRFYRGAQQHDPVSSTTCLWPARGGGSALEKPHAHAPGNLERLKIHPLVWENS